MNKQEDFCLIEKNYDQLLRKLNITTDETAISLVKLQLKSCGPVEGIQILLAQWVKKEKRNCAFHRFLDVLIDIGMNKTAKALRVQFFKAEFENLNINERRFSRSNQTTTKENVGSNIKSESSLHANRQEKRTDSSISNAANGCK